MFTLGPIKQATLVTMESCRNEIYHQTCLMERGFQSSCCQKAATCEYYKLWNGESPTGYGVRQARYIR